MPYAFFTSCTCVPREDVDTLHQMIADGRDVSRRTFMKHCGESARETFRSLGYADHPKQGLTAAADWAIGYYRSAWAGRPCYYFRWSAIEFIFLDPADEKEPVEDEKELAIRY